jgi:hypothetical protein
MHIVRHLEEIPDMHANLCVYALLTHWQGNILYKV